MVKEDIDKYSKLEEMVFPDEQSEYESYSDLENESGAPVEFEEDQV